MLNKLHQTPALSTITSRKENHIKLLLAGRAIQRKFKQKDLYNQGLHPITTDFYGIVQAENARVWVSIYAYLQPNDSQEIHMHTHKIMF